MARGPNPRRAAPVDPAAFGPNAIALAAAASALLSPRNFSVGDFVTWKPGLQNRNQPGPFPVVDLLAKPILDHTPDPMLPAYREPLDCFVLYPFQPTQIQDGQAVPAGPVLFMQMAIDSRRVELAKA